MVTPAIITIEDIMITISLDRFIIFGLLLIIFMLAAKIDIDYLHSSSTSLQCQPSTNQRLEENNEIFATSSTLT